MVEIKVYSSDENAISMLTRLAFKCGGVGSTRRGFYPNGDPRPYAIINYSFAGEADPSSFFGALASLGNKVQLTQPDGNRDSD